MVQIEVANHQLWIDTLFSEPLNETLCLAEQIAFAESAIEVLPKHLFSAIRQTYGVGAISLLLNVGDISPLLVDPTKSSEADKLPYSADLQRIIEESFYDSDSRRERRVGIDNALLALLRQPNFQIELIGMGIDVERINALVKANLPEAVLAASLNRVQLLELVSSNIPAWESRAEQARQSNRPDLVEQALQFRDSWIRVLKTLATDNR